MADAESPEVDEFELFRARAFGVHRESSAVEHHPTADILEHSRRNPSRRLPQSRGSSRLTEENDQILHGQVTINGTDDNCQLERSSSWKAKRGGDPRSVQASTSRGDGCSPGGAGTTPSESLQRTHTMPARRKHAPRQPVKSHSARRRYDDDVTVKTRPVTGDDAVADGGEGDEDDESGGNKKNRSNVYRMRSFYTKAGNVVNQGDSVKVRGLLQTTCEDDDGYTEENGGDKNNLCESETPSQRRQKTRRELVSDASPNIGGRTRGVVTNQRPSSSDFSQDVCRGETSSGSNSRPGTNRPSQDWREGGVVRPGAERVRNKSGGDRGNRHGDEPPSVYKVLVLGSQGVGKTTLTRQLLTSEYLANQDSYTIQEDDTNDKIVSVLLDDEESMMQFIDGTGSEASKTKDLVDANLVVYSVTDRSSFSYAQSCLQELRPAKRHNVVILVANKQDIVRNRIISEEDGKHLASKRHCKFIEVSALLDHKMEDLLVGTLRQIRLRKATYAVHQAPTDEMRSDHHVGRHFGCLQRATIGLIRKLFQRQLVHSSSCDDLFKP